MKKKRIAYRFCNLFTANIEKRVVQPVVCKRLSGCVFGLGDLVVMMDRNVINSAGVNIKRFPEILHGHGRTLNVPAGKANAPEALPAELILARIRELPECEVSRTFFSGLHFDPSDTCLSRDAAKFAVVAYF